ncbi:MAG TPA: type II toxin-antitoxin system VapC family toxin [Chloroflexota bacterium]|jgi:predicted nucleic acid-binding protein
MVERPLVIDASVTLAWCFPDETTPHTDALRGRVTRTGAIVPPHWRIEIENTVRVAERRRRITAAQVADFVRFIRAQLIEVDDRPLVTTFGNLMPLASQYSLSVYDAAYVEIANRRGLPLATLDANMRRAAQQMGIDVLDLS